MEKVALNNVQLDHLAGNHPKLSGMFYGTVPCDRLPRTLPTETQYAFIVNTDPHDEPGTHWIVLWVNGNVCEIMDSYALPLKAYGTTAPLQEWLDRHFKYLFLIDRANRRSIDYFLNRFKKNDYVNNDHKVGQMVKRLIEQEVAWSKICETPCHQDTSGSSKGIVCCI